MQQKINYITGMAPIFVTNILTFRHSLLLIAALTENLLTNNCPLGKTLTLSLNHHSKI